MARRKAQPRGSARIEVKNRYDAAGTGRRMRGWNPPSTGPAKAITGLQTIRNRARDAARNDWAGESATQRWVTNLIGVGITPRLKRITDKERKRELQDLWDRWVPQADADGVLDFYGMQALVVRAWLDSGEVFVRRRYRRPDSGMEVPVQVQLIEAEFVPLLDADAWPGLPEGHKIRQGIELNNRGQRVAYWMFREHPGDGMADMTKLLRVSASEVKHVYEVKRPGQLRGVSALAPVLARLRSISDYDDAVLERQKLANLFAAFITRGVDGGVDLDPLTNMPLEYESDGTPLAGLQPGIIQELDYGQDIKFANPPEAGTTYSDYMRTQHLGTSAAAGVPYELFSNDIKEVSDRTLRVVINEFRRFAEQRQWHTVIPMFCQPVRDWWTDAALLAGHVTQTEYDAVRRVEWAPHGWSYIHPVQDPQGKLLEVQAGFRSRSSVIAERGDDPDTVDEERATDKEREEELGLVVDPMDAQQQDQPADIGDTDGIDDNEYSAPPNPNPVEAALREAQLALLQAQAEALRSREPTQVIVNNHIPETRVENVVPVPDVKVEAPDVHVEAPVVNVAVPEAKPPVVNVTAQAAPATVNVKAFPQKAEQVVERDESGEIVKTTILYKE